MFTFPTAQTADSIGFLPFAPQTTVYSFGPPTEKSYGYMVLMRDGGVYCYSHPNESGWRWENDRMVLVNQQGFPTSEYRYHSTADFFKGNAIGSKHPLNLTSVVHLDESSASKHLPGLVINSIPKAGTYFVEAAFASMGWEPTRCHLSSDCFDDYRGMPDDQIHRCPAKVKIPCAMDAFCAILQPGQIAVGHVNEVLHMQSARRLGRQTISLVRNLRDVVVSMYRFKLNKVEPVTVADHIWRKIQDEAARFEAYLALDSEKEFFHVGQVARTILADRETPILKYEDIVSGRISAVFSARLETIEPGLSHRLVAALQGSVNKSTPTFSGGRSNWTEHWTPLAEEFFVRSGLAEVNRSLGYQ